MTEKLYDQNAYCTSFTAKVIRVEQEKDRYAVYLDATAFFPESGGQSADTGTLNAIPVLYVKETEQGIAHYLPSPMAVGECIRGEIDFVSRFRNMQIHTAEHILSGLAHTLFGCENVGFHLSKTEVTCDYDKPLTDADIALLETETNKAIYRNVSVKAEYPSAESLATLSYRSKGELAPPVRIVTIEGYDRCACCAPHVAKTGEIGGFTISSFERYKGGTRCFLKAGADALDYIRSMRTELMQVSHLLSAPFDKCGAGVKRLYEECAELRQVIYGLRQTVSDMRIASAVEKEGLILFFESQAEPEDMRRVLNGCVGKCQKACGFFVGDDTKGYRFTLASATCPLLPVANTLRQKGIKCGGTNEMISGHISHTQTEIEHLIKTVLA